MEKYSSLFEIYQNPDTTVYVAREKTDDAANMPNTGEITASGTENGYCYDVISDAFIRITGADYEQMDPNTEVLRIPDTVQGMPVKEIGYFAFCRAGEHLSSLKEVVVPQSVEIIGERAFSRVFCGPNEAMSDGMTAEEKKQYRINIPENVRFIGFRAFYCSAFAVCSQSEDARVIHLPESLEFLSSQAFVAGEIQSRFLSKDTIEVDMPESLVFMSYDGFLGPSSGNLTPDIPFIKWEDVLSDDIPEAYLPLMRSAIGKGFYNAERNVVTMQDVLRKYLTENGMTVPDVIKRTHSYEAYTSEDSHYQGYRTKMEYWLDLAARNAPELLPADAPADRYGTFSLYGDVNMDKVVDVSDAVMLARYCTGSPDVNISDAGLYYADVNNDGSVTPDDALAIVKKIAGT